MGTSALQQRFRHNSEFPLLTSVQLLGVFGVLHGLAEWIAMLRIVGVYQSVSCNLYTAETFLMGLSFLFLLIFGFSMTLKETAKNIKVHIWVPLLIFTLWSFFFLGRIFSVPEDLNWQITFFNNIARYFMGFPGALMAGISYLQNGLHLKSLKLKKYSNMYFGSGILFIVYGVSSGLVIAPLNIFPANMINRDVFMNITNTPIEVIRAFAAIGITVLTIQIFDSFSWEIQRRLNEYEQQQALMIERKMTIQMVHDQVIQRLFGSGMMVESLMETVDNDIHYEKLDVLRKDLNETILEAREFLKTFTSTYMGIEDFQENLFNLVERFRRNNNINLDYKYLVPDMVLGKISKEMNTELYYIIQEALMNIQKHAQAEHVWVRIYANLKEIIAEIEDNGIGFSMKEQNEEGYGLRNIKDRTKKINGNIHLKSSREGTKLMIRIPWEE